MDQEILSVIMMVILTILIILFVLVSNSKKLSQKIQTRILTDLKQIKILIDTKNPLLFRDIIIRLDSLLSKTLQIYYQNNENCGSNLKKAKNLFKYDEYNKIWEMHKLRNSVVHENVEVGYSQITQAYNIIGGAIKKILYE
jgi:hypothetical protein